jgi:hypothetical protein
LHHLAQPHDIERQQKQVQQKWWVGCGEISVGNELATFLRSRDLFLELIASAKVGGN